jgi:hypothetical protein
MLLQLGAETVREQRSKLFGIAAEARLGVQQDRIRERFDPQRGHSGRRAARQTQ